MPSFTRVQGNTGTTATTFTVPVTLGATPTQGNIVCVVAITFNNGSNTTPTCTVADANGKNYTVVGTAVGGFSPTNYNGFVSLAYLLVPAGASSTITATFSLSTGGACIFADEFAPVGGTISADNHASALDITGTGLTFSPTIPVSGNPDLCYVGITTPNGEMISGAPNSPYSTGGAGSVIAQEYSAAYALGEAANSTPQFNVIAGGVTYAAAGMSFLITPSSTPTPAVPWVAECEALVIGKVEHRSL